MQQYMQGLVTNGNGKYWQYDESKSQEMIERKIKSAPAAQGTVRMLSQEEWEEIRQVRPRTPFESKLARPNARIRTGEPLHVVSYKLHSLLNPVCPDLFVSFSLLAVMVRG